MNKNIISVIYAVLAAVFYSINLPFSKILLKEIPPTLMASLLYLGAGVGVGIIYIFRKNKEDKSDRLGKEDLPYVLGMIFLDIIAPIFLMIGINIGSSANASLLGNFEIVATSLIAFFLFQEYISKKLSIAIILITISSIILSFDSAESLKFSYGSLFVILATISWGFENNCTRKISDKSIYQIVTIKGIFSGLGAFLVFLIFEFKVPSNIYFVFLAMLLGFVAYGLSIFTYIKAQNNLGAAKTSAYYAIAPFISTFLSLTINKENTSILYFISFFIMIIGTYFVISDTLSEEHLHEHTHKIWEISGGKIRLKEIKHTHKHSHILGTNKHRHNHIN